VTHSAGAIYCENNFKPNFLSFKLSDWVIQTQSNRLRSERVNPAPVAGPDVEPL
jgi:hypothetical protein